MTPGAISVGTLRSGDVGSGVRIIGLAGAASAVWAVSRSSTGVGPSVRIVIGACSGAIVGTVNAPTGSIRTSIRVIVGTPAISNRVRMVVRETVARVINIGRVIIASAVSQNRAHSHSTNKCSR